MHMPHVDRNRWKDRRAELDLDLRYAAGQLKINPRTLQNIETTAGYPVGLRVIHRASRLYRLPVAELLAQDPAEQVAS